MDNPIFILGAHKSGTSLLRSLFDGHPDLFVVPVEEHLFKHLGFQIDYSYQYQPAQEYTSEEIKQNFFNWISNCNTKSDKYADSIAKNVFDLEKFKYVLDLKNPDSLAELSNLYFDAIHQSIYRLPRFKRVLTKSVENAEFCLEVKKLFPNAKFIHIVRNPYASFVALRKYKSTNGKYPLVSKLLKALYTNYYYLSKNKWLLGDDYIVLRYEDLLIHTESIMKDLSVRLSLSFNQSLLTPTHLGKKWEGNSTSNKSFSGINTSTIDSWKKDIFNYEIYLVNTLFRSVLKTYNYEEINPKGSIYRFMKNEGLLRYFFNRLYKYYLPNKK